MKVICLQENLARGLAIVGRAVASRSTLPVLSNILLESDEGRLRLAATNLEIGVSCWIGARVEEEGRTTVPARLLTELLLPHTGVGELRLLAPALAALQRQQRTVMWFDPPAAPCAWALAGLGLEARQFVVVCSRGGARGRARERLPAADVLWALEQALGSGHLGAVLAWLPARLPADALRRLQLAAQAHDGPAFLLRDAQQRTRPSAAPLRLLLASAGADLLRVTLLKRRGPPPAQPLTLALAPVLTASARARAGAARGPATAAPCIVAAA
mgnify:CR=1 FL=1